MKACIEQSRNNEKSPEAKDLGTFTNYELRITNYKPPCSSFLASSSFLCASMIGPVMCTGTVS